MIVTINTDASFCPHTNVAAYAFWIVCNQGKIIYSGALKEGVTNSIDAEMRCIANALYALKKSNFTGVTRVIINSDALWAFDYIKKSAKEGSSARKCHNLLGALKKKYKVSGRKIHEFRHVKAHTNKDDARSWVNEWCDKNAKKHLAEQRELKGFKPKNATA